MPQWHLIPVPSVFLTERRNPPNWEDSEVQRTKYRLSVPEPTSRREQESSTKPKYQKGRAHSERWVLLSVLISDTSFAEAERLIWPILSNRRQSLSWGCPVFPVVEMKQNAPGVCLWAWDFQDQAGGLVPCKPLALAFIASWHRVWTVVECGKTKLLTLVFI